MAGGEREEFGVADGGGGRRWSRTYSRVADQG